MMVLNCCVARFSGPVPAVRITPCESSIVLLFLVMNVIPSLDGLTNSLTNEAPLLAVGIILIVKSAKSRFPAFSFFVNIYFISSKERRICSERQMFEFYEYLRRPLF